MTKLSKMQKQTGLDFSGYIHIDELGNQDVYGCSYEPSYDMPDILEHLKINKEDNFFDIGCGKGYAMFYFSKLNFGCIDGIEYDKKLADIARDNFSKLKDDRFTVFEGDACKFTDLDKYNYIYMYNPLQQDGIKEIAKNLKESIKKNPRNVFLIYQNPRFYEEFTKDNTFRGVVTSGMTLILKHDK